MRKIIQKPFGGSCCIAILSCLTWLLLLPEVAAGASKEQTASLRPLLLLEDAQRSLVRTGEPQLLLVLAKETPSAWVASEARAGLAGHYALTGNWTQYDKLASSAGACAKFLHAIYLQPTALAATAGPALAGSARDPVCRAALRSATAGGFLRDRDIWHQIRVLVDAGKSREARLFLGLLKESQVSAGTLNQAIQNATRRLKGKHALATRVSQELLAVSAVVVARRQPLLAGERWAKFAAHIDADISESLWPTLGKRVSLEHKPQQAMGYFRQAPLAKHSRQDLAWRVRAALRLGDWAEVRDTIAAMRGEQAGLSAWRYWHAHALHQLGDKAVALVAWRQVAEEFDDYYGLLAAEIVGKDLRLGQARPDPALVAKLAKNADVRLATELGAMGRTLIARKVWRFLLARLGGTAQLSAAKVAAQRGWLLGAINAADFAAPQHSSYALRFPLPLRGQILPLAQRLGVDPTFIYSLIRQESRFDPSAKSSAGARGLMQVMPATAREVARKHKYTRYHISRLTRPATNLLIGSRYVADLVKRFGNDPVLVAVAYNAGPHRAHKWLKSSKGVDKMVFIESIPFTETRLYVKAILGAQAHYGLVLSLPTLPLLQRLGGRYS